MSVYKILRPPKKGNCSREVEDEDEHWQDITFDDFKNAFSENFVASYRKEHQKNIQIIIEDQVKTERWVNVEVMFLVDEMSDNVMDHLVYTNTGYICHKMLGKEKVQKCNTCNEAFSSCNENSIFPLANLVDIKSQGKLIYPNFQLLNRLTPFLITM